VVHREWFPVYVLYVHFKRGKLPSLSAALLKELIEFLAVRIVEDPLMGSVKLEFFIRMLNLLKPVPKAFDISCKFSCRKNPRNIEERFGWEFGTVTERTFVNCRVPMHSELCRTSAFFIREVVLEFYYFCEEFVASYGIATRGRALNN
jgi:hypothetical protein